MQILVKLQNMPKTIDNSLDCRAGTPGKFQSKKDQCHDAVKDASSIQVGNLRLDCWL